MVSIFSIIHPNVFIMIKYTIKIRKILHPEFPDIGDRAIFNNTYQTR